MAGFEARYRDPSMERTSIDLDDRRLAALRAISRQQGRPVAALVREAVDAWLAAQGAGAPDNDEWGRRFAALLDRRGRLAAAHGRTAGGWTAETVEADVARAVADVRRSHAARRP
jgi:hypothetical protein